MKYMISLMKEIFKKRKLIWDLAKSDFKKRFVGSYFGVVWMFIQPIATVLVYYFVFQLGLKSTSPVEHVAYVIWLVPGIVPWFYFSEAMNGVSGCLQEYHYLVKKVVFQVEILPIIKLISCLLVHGFFVLIMLVVCLLYRMTPLLTWIQVVYYTFAASMLILGLGFLTSAVQVFFKDMAQIIGVCLQFGMWMTPIMYHESLFSDMGMEGVSRMLKFNPFYYITTGYRDSMLTGNWFWERPVLSLYYWTVTIVVLIVGLKAFKRLRPHFSDVL